MTTRELHLPSRARASREGPRDRASRADPAGLTNGGIRTEHDVACILQAAYRPFERATDLVQAIVDALVEQQRVPVVEARVAIDGARVRPSHSTGRASAPRGSRSGALSTWPCVYHGRVLGELLIDAVAVDRDTEHQSFRLPLCRAVGQLLQRYEVRRSARTQLGHDLWFVGIAPALRMLEARIEDVAALTMPLLIEAEFGCETTAAALSVHVAGRPSEPFRELRCGEARDAGSFRAALESLASETKGGTLFLKDVDELDPLCQKELAECLEWSSRAQVSLLFDTAPPVPSGLRIVASTSRGLKELSEAGVFSRRLWAVLDYLRLRVPPLRERREDIPFLLEYYGSNFDRADRRTFSGEASAILSAWGWSGNLAELERTLARLIATTRSPVIDIDHLREWAAELMPGAPGTSDVHTRDDIAESDIDREPSDGAPALAPVVLARQLLEGRFDDIQALHPGLQRALRCLADHFQEEIALERLARESFVSQSYLCALFKKGLGIGFKRFQSILRVEKAKELLVHNRHHRITDISLEVGFGDFSHFLKTFKRIIHISPREFRKRHAGAPDFDRSV